MLTEISLQTATSSALEEWLRATDISLRTVLLPNSFLGASVAHIISFKTIYNVIVGPVDSNSFIKDDAVAAKAIRPTNLLNLTIS